MIWVLGCRDRRHKEVRNRMRRKTLYLITKVAGKDKYHMSGKWEKEDAKQTLRRFRKEKKSVV